MVTKHYLPAFVRRDAEGREQAVCGTFITAAERLVPGDSTECWGCRLWLHEVEHPHVTPQERARVLAQITEVTPYGEPMTDRDDHATRRRLTRYERLEALADSGCDTREEYEGLR